MEAPASYISITFERSNMIRFLPSWVPLCLALFIPARTRSRASSRSNSATDARIRSNRRDVGLDSSVSMDWETARNLTPCARSASIPSKQFRTLRPKRSSFHTSTASKHRSAASFRHDETPEDMLLRLNPETLTFDVQGGDAAQITLVVSAIRELGPSTAEAVGECCHRTVQWASDWLNRAVDQNLLWALRH
jgi:hypothetical protein